MSTWFHITRAISDEDRAAILANDDDYDLAYRIGKDAPVMTWTPTMGDNILNTTCNDIPLLYRLPVLPSLANGTRVGDMGPYATVINDFIPTDLLPFGHWYTHTMLHTHIIITLFLIACMVYYRLFDIYKR